jgi:hypothetical protein
LRQHLSIFLLSTVSKTSRIVGSKFHFPIAKRPEHQADHYFHLAPRITKREATPPLPHTPYGVILYWERRQICLFAFLPVLSRK